MKRRCAFSLIELVVVISVIAILAGLALTALGATREAARRTRCQNNFRQIGIGLHQYVNSSGGKLPKQSRIATKSIPDGVGPWFDMADSLELTQHARIVISASGVKHVSHRVELMMCPSDGEQGCNYRTCGSSGYSLLGESSVWPRPSDTGDGLIPCVTEDKYLVHVRDGLSNTAFSSERLIAGGSARDKRSILAGRLFNPFSISLAPPHTALVEEVRNRWSTGRDAIMIAKLWHGQGLGQTAYNHAAAPNEDVAALFSGTSFDATMGVVPPTSNHPGGVNLCQVDGSVRFVTEQIDHDVWVAFATVDASD